MFLLEQLFANALFLFLSFSFFLHFGPE